MKGKYKLILSPCPSASKVKAVKKLCVKMVKSALIFAVISCVLAILYVIFVPKPKSRVVETTAGKIRGFVDSSRDGRDFESFLGIPYAQPPVGNLRFEPPKPPLKWHGVKDAIDYGSMCSQVDNLYWKIVGSEDCLFINVFKPRDVGPKFLPVIAYIHGGYFMTGGSQNHKPKYFMDEDVIFVTFNYRVGALGFLNTQDGVIRGNMGLRDQTLALKWIQDNIQNFGGNPDMVTLFGESAGASAVHFHMLSPMSKGLFHKAISNSGTAIKLWSLYTRPKEQAKRLAKRTKCPVDSKALLKCLKKLKMEEIIGLQIETITPLLNELHMYGPTVESTEAEKKDAFLPDHPYTLMTEMNHTIPWITGTNSEEGLLITGRVALDPPLLMKLEYDWQSALPDYLVYPPELKNITTLVTDFYITSKPVKSGEKLDFETNFQNLTNLLTDRLYLVATRESALQHAKKAPVFLYYYKHHGEHSFTVFFGVGDSFVTLKFAWRLLYRFFANRLGLIPDDRGVSHGDDLFMFFKVPFMHVETWMRDYDFSKSLINLYVQFAYNEHNMTFYRIPWKPIPLSAVNGDSKLQYLTFEDSRDDHGIKDEEFTDRIRFWEKLNMPWIT